MLYQPSIVKDEDLVCIYNCTEAVGDHNNRLTFHQFGNRLLNQDFILRVKGCCCLVKQNNGSVFQQGASDGNTLALTAGKSAAVFTENRLIPVRHLPDKFITIGGFGRGNHLIVRCVWIAKTDIVHNRIIEQGHILEHERHIRHEAFRLHTLDVFAAHGDLALLNIPKAGNQFGNRAFTGTGRPNEGSHAPLGDFAGNIFDDIFLIVGKSHMGKFNIAVRDRFPVTVHCRSGEQGTHTTCNYIQIQQRGQIRQDCQNRAINPRDHQQEHEQRQQFNLSTGQEDSTDKDCNANTCLQNHAGAGHKHTDSHLHFDGDFFHC